MQRHAFSKDTSDADIMSNEILARYAESCELEAARGRAARQESFKNEITASNTKSDEILALHEQSCELEAARGWVAKQESFKHDVTVSAVITASISNQSAPVQIEIAPGEFR